VSPRKRTARKDRAKDRPINAADCAAAANGMPPCTTEHVKNGSACGYCAPLRLDSRTLRDRIGYLAEMVESYRASEELGEGRSILEEMLTDVLNAADDVTAALPADEGE
jgi:hypothetical protein